MSFANLIRREEVQNPIRIEDTHSNFPILKSIKWPDKKNRIKWLVVSISQVSMSLATVRLHAWYTVFPLSIDDIR